MIESPEEELSRLRRENAVAGDLITEIARELGCLLSSREAILSGIARLQEKASRTDVTPTEGRSANLLRRVAHELDANGHHGLILDEKLIEVARDRMESLRTYKQRSRW